MMLVPPKGGFALWAAILWKARPRPRHARRGGEAPKAFRSSRFDRDISYTGEKKF
jgi:hypothetical protein